MAQPSVLVIDDITIELTYKPIKHLHLRVHPPDGHVTISAPPQMAVPIIDAFVRSKLPWIRQQQAQYQRFVPQPPREILERESHYVWGVRYLLHQTIGTRYHIDVTPTQLVLTAPVRSTTQQRATYMHRWYRQQLQQVLPALVEKWSKTLGVQVNNVFIQHMKSRWGSCNYRAGHIRINTELAKYPPHLLEYVLVHELVHLLEPSHNKRFYALLNQFRPSWHVDRQQLQSDWGRGE
jgi:predicted metal-dependent hydrolase